MFDILVREAFCAERKVDNYQVDIWVHLVPVKYKLGIQWTLLESRAPMRNVLGSPVDFQVSANDVPVVEDKINEEEDLCNFCDLTSKEDRGSTVIQRF